MSNQYDHCRNCRFWDHENKNESNKAKCGWHGDETPLRGWCGHHKVRNVIDGNDPSVIHSTHLEVTLRLGVENFDKATEATKEIIKSWGYNGPEDIWEPIRNYDTDYPKQS